MRCLILGSTKQEIHFGCHALTNGLELLIKEKFGSNSYIQHLSNKYLSPHFLNKLFEVNKITKKQALKTLFNYSEKSSFFLNSSFDAWVTASKEMMKQDLYIRFIIESSDIIVINVEGTIHHGALLGRQLLALGYMGQKLNKKVYWTNVTIQDENEEILKMALNDAVSIGTREKMTLDYLHNMDIDVVQAFDTAVLANYNNKNSLQKNFFLNREKKYCLVTGSANKNYSLSKIFRSIVDFGLTPYYIAIGQNDVYDLDEAKKLGIEHLNLNELSFYELIEFIKKFTLVVSGRHHLNILSIIAGVPFVPFESNTWKIEAVCEMIDYSIPKIDFFDKIHFVMDQKKDIQRNFKNQLPILKELARRNIPQN